MAYGDWQDITHTGPDTLAGRYLRMFWQPVYRAQDLPAGRAVPVRIMGEDLTLYRGESGRAYVVGAACGHRGLQPARLSLQHQAQRMHAYIFPFTMTQSTCPSNPTISSNKLGP